MERHSARIYPEHPTVQCEYATRFVTGARIVVTQCPAVVTFLPQPRPKSLPRHIFTTDELAALAADPAFLS